MRTAQVLLAMLAAHHAPQGTKQITLAFQMAFQQKNKTRLFFLNHYLESSVQITPATNQQHKKAPRGDAGASFVPFGLIWRRHDIYITASARIREQQHHSVLAIVCLVRSAGMRLRG
ncbi:hypothetical protein [Pseudomonas viridiflava]|uniref:hypothetical protein n=1 Tax=Pseudomonas viridiflava TaxID=33069 RepID=UPI000F05058A|nr:hypothetical protein [Pseudomonas viridiflava]